MCLLIFAHCTSNQYPLLLAANRDEFHQRPTAPSAFWPDYPDLLAGRDELSGGTWMGVTRDGKFAAVTNYRDPSATHDAPRSRGELPLAYLIGKQHPQAYLEAVSQRAGEYAGFNLLVGRGDELWYINNNSQGSDVAPAQPRALPPGIYGLSNAQLDTPWPKVSTGKQRLQEMTGDSAATSHDNLLELVSSQELASAEALGSLGMDTTMDRLLSAQFIRSETYGTRSSTTLWRDGQGNTSWRELSFDARGKVSDRRQENFPTR
ncbi:MAG: NRDE family protein [Halioglobus sp.]